MSVAGAASLGTPTTMQRLTLPTVVLSAGAKSCAVRRHRPDSEFGGSSKLAQVRIAWGRGQEPVQWRREMGVDYDETVPVAEGDAADPDLLIDFAKVSLRRGGQTLVGPVTWSVELDERWVVIGPNGAGKTSLLRIAAAMEYPSSGTAFVLGERLGRVDMSELRSRVGLSSSALSQRVPDDEVVRDLVVSAGYSVLGRWREQLRRRRLRAGGRHAGEHRRRASRRTHLRHAVRRGAQAGPDRAVDDDRPRTAVARRARRRPGPRRPRGAGRAAGGPGAGPGFSRAGVGHPPRRGDPAWFLPLPDPVRGQDRRLRPAPRRADRGELSKAFGQSIVLDASEADTSPVGPEAGRRTGGEHDDRRSVDPEAGRDGDAGPRTPRRESRCS